jgi:hypothetical protein
MWAGLAVVVGLLLAACGSGTQDVQPASGDGVRPIDLTETASFAANDDLNLVITMKTHSGSAPVSATFIDPTGVSYSTDPIEAGRAAGQLVLGLDFESHGGLQWTPGDWTAVVYVDGKEDQTVQFNVRPPVSEPLGEG